MTRNVYTIALLLLLSVVANAQKIATCSYRKTYHETDYYTCEDGGKKKYTRNNLIEEPSPHEVMYSLEEHFILDKYHSKWGFDMYWWRISERLFLTKSDCKNFYESRKKQYEREKREYEEHEAFERNIKDKSAKASDDARKKMIQENSGYIIDERDGRKYRITTIVSQTWIAENIDFKTEGSACPLPQNCEETGFDCDEKKTCEKYGRIYPLNEAQKVCPEGWRLPNEKDIENLFGRTLNGGAQTRALLVKGWGSDEYGMSILPSPNVIEGKALEDLSVNKNYWNGPMAYFWMAPKGRWWYASTGGEVRHDKNNRYGKKDVDFASIRCIKDEPSGIQVESGIMRDSRDGKTYKTAKIAKQEWMAENLNYSKLGVCYENKNENCDKYGRIYTATEAKKACPSGWHLPDRREWDMLKQVVGRDTTTFAIFDQDRSSSITMTAANSLRSVDGWGTEEYEKGDDDFGLSVKPGYYEFRGRDGFGSNDGKVAVFWNSNEINSKYTSLTYLRPHAMAVIDDKKESRFSVRCISDKPPIYSESAKIIDKAEKETNSESNDSKPATESSSHEVCKATVAKAKNTYNRCVTLPKGTSERLLCTKKYNAEKEDASKACIIRRKN